MEFWKFDKSKFVEFNYLKILSVIEFFFNSNVLFEEIFQFIRNDRIEN